MARKQLVALFLCSLVPWTAGNGLVPLLPLYATRLGADAAAAGYYLALSYLALALGALSAGWVSAATGRRKLPLVVAGLAGIPVAWLMGRAGAVWSLAALTAALWFCGGLGLALTGILAGLSAGEHERGRVFGMLALTNGLGTVIGGLGAGWLADRWGFTAMFSVLAAVLLAWPVFAAFVEEQDAGSPRSARPGEQNAPGLGRDFYLLFAAGILTSITGFVVVLLRSLLMSDLAFGPLAIASTGAAGGLIALPLPVLMGWLSDRTGRKAFLLIAGLAALAAVVVLAFSRALWHFWAVMVCYQVAVQGSASVGSALVTDLAPRPALGKALALLGAAGWIGGVIGFAVAGYTLQHLGLATTVVAGAGLALAGVGLLTAIHAPPNARSQPGAAAV